MTRVRLIVQEEHQVKKLPTRTLTIIPRIGEIILWNNKDFEVIKVYHDLEMDSYEMCLDLKLLEKHKEIK